MKPLDITRRVVTRQLDAMSINAGFELGVLVPENPLEERDATMLLRDWDEATLLKSLGWLKGQNTAGSHVFIRPRGSTGLIFLDDINRATLDTLSADGLVPAAVLESSPLNYQAWIRVSPTPISKALALACAQLLAKRYDGDFGAASWRQFGRLAGFTNRKPAYVETTGHYPFVKLTSTSARALEHTCTPAVQSLLADAQALADENARLCERRREKSLGSSAQRTDSALPPAVDFFSEEYRQISERFGEKLNASRADWRIALTMRDLGYSSEDVFRAIADGSDQIVARKGRYVEQYARRTANKVFGVG